MLPDGQQLCPSKPLNRDLTARVKWGGQAVACEGGWGWWGCCHRSAGWICDGVGCSDGRWGGLTAWLDVLIFLFPCLGSKARLGLVFVIFRPVLLWDWSVLAAVFWFFDVGVRVDGLWGWCWVTPTGDAYFCCCHPGSPLLCDFASLISYFSISESHLYICSNLISYFFFLFKNDICISFWMRLLPFQSCYENFIWFHI